MGYRIDITYGSPPTVDLHFTLIARPVGLLPVREYFYSASTANSC